MVAKSVGADFPCYIVLGISLRTYSPYQNENPPSTVCSTGYKHARIISVRLPDAETGKYQRSGHWRMCVEVDRRNIATARYVASGLESLLALLNHGPMEDLSVQLVPSNALCGRTILQSELVKWAETAARKTGNFYLEKTFRSLLGTFYMLRRPVTWFEAMDAQHLAHSVLSSAMRHEFYLRRRPEGSDEEIRYLLGVQYPFHGPPGWLEQRSGDLQDMTPVQAIRHPNGPQKIDFLAEEL
jgi:hypothetical protein